MKMTKKFNPNRVKPGQVIELKWNDSKNTTAIFLEYKQGHVIKKFKGDASILAIEECNGKIYVQSYAVQNQIVRVSKKRVDFSKLFK